MGLFDFLFDFDHNGSFGKAAELGGFMGMMDYEKNNALTEAGLDPDELEDMGYLERLEALEAAGLDPDDFGF